MKALGEALHFPMVAPTKDYYVHRKGMEFFAEELKVTHSLCITKNHRAGCVLGFFSPPIVSGLEWAVVPRICITIHSFNELNLLRQLSVDSVEERVMSIGNNVLGIILNCYFIPLVLVLFFTSRGMRILWSLVLRWPRQEIIHAG